MSAGVTADLPWRLRGDPRIRSRSRRLADIYTVYLHSKRQRCVHSVYCQPSLRKMGRFRQTAISAPPSSGPEKNEHRLVTTYSYLNVMNADISQFPSMADSTGCIPGLLLQCGIHQCLWYFPGALPVTPVE